MFTKTIQTSTGIYNFLGAPILSISDARNIEQMYGADLGLYELMQAAGLALKDEMIKVASKALIDCSKACWVIIVGSGNNGGDGYEIASNLLADGYTNVSVLYSNLPKPNKSAAKARARYLSLKGNEQSIFEQREDEHSKYQFNKDALNLIQHADIIVDAIVGIGIDESFDIKRKNVQPLVEACKLLNSNLNPTALVFAVDVPSFFNAQTGKPVISEAVRAMHTFSVFGYHIGFLLHNAVDFVGGIHPVYPKITDMHNILQDLVSTHNVAFSYESVKDVLPKRALSAHKGVCGRVVLVGGNKGMHGALMLSAMGTMRSGAGLITAAFLDESGVLPLNVVAPEVMSLSVHDDTFKGVLSKADSIVIGPGFGRDKAAKEEFNDIVRSVDLTSFIVIDADGLWHLHNYYLAHKIHGTDFILSKNCILTPHVGEAAMLLDENINEVMADPIKASQMISQKYHAVCVLKSNRTFIASYDEKNVWVGVVGSCAMATGGMGDLLSGIVGALCNSTKSKIVASILAVAIHGEAGTKVGQEEGEIGACATDLLPFIRRLCNLRQW